jgi:hypothetical protein
MDHCPLEEIITRIYVKLIKYIIIYILYYKKRILVKGVGIKKNDFIALEINSFH